MGYRNFAEEGNCTSFADNRRSCQRILDFFFFGGGAVRRLLNNKPFDFGGDSGILNRISSTPG